MNNLLEIVKKIAEYAEKMPRWCFPVFILTLMLWINHIVGGEILEITFILFLLGLIGIFVFISKKTSLGREKCIFLGFIVLIFTVIYCVSYLDYEIAGAVSISKIKKMTKEVEEVKDSVNEAEERINATTIKYLGDMSMWHNVYGGDNRSYASLLNWKNTAKDSIMIQLLSTEIERVKGVYRVNIMRENIDRWNLICKPHAIPSCSKGYEDSRRFSAHNVLDHLSPEKRWDERARAACLLRNIRTASDKKNITKELFEKLVAHMNPEIENSLCVAKMAFETYKDLTGYQSNGVFDFEGAVKNWKQRQKEILRMEF